MSDAAQSWTDKLPEYEQRAHEVCDLAILKTKDGRFWQVVSWLLYLLSFRQFSRQTFLERFATTMGPIQAYPSSWKGISALLVTHESQHCQQCLFAGWFVPVFGWFFGRRVRIWVGLLPMAFVYGLFPLPLFFAWGRFRLELDAERRAWQAALDNGWLSPERIIQRADEKGELVASWSYLRSWPKKWAVQSFQRRAERLVELWNQQQASSKTES